MNRNIANWLLGLGLLWLGVACAPKPIKLTGNYSLCAASLHGSVTLKDQRGVEVVGADIVHFNQSGAVIYGQRVDRAHDNRMQFFIVNTHKHSVELFASDYGKNYDFTDQVKNLTGKQNIWEDLHTFWDFRDGGKSEDLLWQNR